jgi:predicted amidohydrolase
MRISCVQMNMIAAQPEHNFVHAEELIRQAAAAERPDVVVLPETWNTGFAPSKIDASLADENGMRTKGVFSALAKECRVNIVAGSVANRRDGRQYNTAFVFDRAGECIANYDKTHLFSPMGEDKAFEAGNALARFQLDGVECAIIICYDVRFPELTRTLALPGLDLLFVVSQWPQQRIDHLSVLSRARAIENQVFVAACNSCGEAFGTKFGGHSVLIDPWGTVLAEAGETETTITAEINPAVLREVRDTIPVLSDRRAELYDLDKQSLF